MTARRQNFSRAASAVALLLGLAVTLRLLDAGPRLATRAARIRELPSVEEAERLLGRRLALPAYFPRSLRWPPIRVRAVGPGPNAVILELGGAESGAPHMYLAQSGREPGPLPDALFPPATVLHQSRLPFRGATAVLTRLRGEEGTNWVHLSWVWEGQSLAMRSRGSVEQLLEVAGSIHREGP